MSKPEGLALARRRIADEKANRTGFLDLSHLGLTELPEELFELGDLERLKLGQSQLDDSVPKDRSEPSWINRISASLGRLGRLPRLRHLELGLTDLVDLSPLSGLSGLQSLDCSRTPVSDLAPLSGLSGLQSLQCSITQISDLAPLTGLSGLQSLDCSRTPVSDLAPLSSLSGLQSLNCSDTQISDLAPLSSLSGLQSLQCSITQISDLAPLSSLSGLQSLQCWGTRVSDLAPLSGLSGLQSLNCSDTQISDLAPLSGLSGLQSLQCWGTRVSDLAPLSGLSGLQSLNCSDTQISDLAPLSSLSGLQSLQCSITQISDLAPLSSLSGLQSLQCWGTRVSDLAPLSGLSGLQSLNCSDTPVSDLAPLTGLSGLQSLDCSNTPVSDLAPLTGLSGLQSLQCSSTQISDLAPLSGLSGLQSLDCSRTPVSDLAPLSGLSGLQSLQCWGTRVSDLAPLSGLSGLQSLNCSDTQISDLAPLSGLSGLREIKCFDSKVEVLAESLLGLPELHTLTLRCTALKEIPAELQSQDFRDNCLWRLRAHFRDLGGGSERLPDVKVLVLGNGRIGKTQICRRLRGDAYDEHVGSTHGISVTSTWLPIGAGPGRDESQALLHLWDFGGQDLYHGTHGLFLRTRSIFVIVWTTSSENEGTHEHGGITFRNHRLPYWAETVRHLSGTDQPLILVQNQCDRAEDEELRPPIDDGILLSFPSRKLVHYSARLDRGRGALDDALRQAVERQWELQGRALIGRGWLEVRRRLERLQQEDDRREVSEKQHRTISRDEFDAFCAEVGGVSSTDVLLEYLHAAGVVIHHPGLFGGRIILDHAWALAAVYAVFDRKACYQILRSARGRFTRPLLEELVWRQHSVPEQELFLNLMASCGICFVHRQGDERRGLPTEYIAPDLLPDRAEVELELESMWAEREQGDSLTVRLPFLPPGLIRGLISRIGQQAGVSAIYWKDGLCFYEQVTRSYARVNQHLDPSHARWGGRLDVETRAGQSLELLARLRTWLEDLLRREAGEGWTIDDPTGKRPSEWHVHAVSSLVASAEARAEGSLIEPRVDGVGSPAEQRLLSPGTPPINANTYGMSYAWNDPSREIVERVCQSAEARGKRVLRDTTGLRAGDSFLRFVKQLGSGNRRLFVILSDKYLRSQYCMTELLEVWFDCRRDPDAFAGRIRAYRLPDAKIHRPIDRVDYVGYWKEELSALKKEIERVGWAEVGSEMHRSYERIREVADNAGRLLEVIADRIDPRDFEEFEQYGFGD